MACCGGGSSYNLFPSNPKNPKGYVNSKGSFPGPKFRSNDKISSSKECKTCSTKVFWY